MPLPRFRENHLALFPFLFDHKVIGTDKTNFQQLLRRTSDHKIRADTKVLPHLGTMTLLRKRFLAIAGADISSRVPRQPAKSLYQGLLWLYVGKRVYRWRRIQVRKFTDQWLDRNSATAGSDETSGFEGYF